MLALRGRLFFFFLRRNRSRCSPPLSSPSASPSLSSSSRPGNRNSSRSDPGVCRSFGGRASGTPETVATLAERECDGKDGVTAKALSLVKRDCFRSLERGSLSSGASEDARDRFCSGVSLSEAFCENCTLRAAIGVNVPGNGERESSSSSTGPGLCGGIKTHQLETNSRNINL